MKKLLLLAILLVGCSIVRGSTPNPEVQLTLISLSNRYLAAIGSGEVRHAGALILWPEYIKHKSGVRTKDEILEDIVRAPTVLPMGETSPLNGLRLRRVSSSNSGNNSKVVLEKEGADDVVLEYVWNGSGWMITNDTLLGPGHTINKLIVEKDTQSEKQQ